MLLLLILGRSFALNLLEKLDFCTTKNASHWPIRVMYFTWLKNGVLWLFKLVAHVSTLLLAVLYTPIRKYSTSPEEAWKMHNETKAVFSFQHAKYSIGAFPNDWTRFDRHISKPWYRSMLSHWQPWGNIMLSNALWVFIENMEATLITLKTYITLVPELNDRTFTLFSLEDKLLAFGKYHLQKALCDKMSAFYTFLDGLYRPFLQQTHCFFN